jgi:hypothetical protein
MKKSKLYKLKNIPDFKKGDQIYGLIPHSMYSFLMLRFKGRIHDMKFDSSDILWYYIEILDFQETTNYIKRFVPNLKLKYYWDQQLIDKPNFSLQYYNNDYEKFRSHFSNKPFYFWLEFFYVFESEYKRNLVLRDTYNIGIEELLYNIEALSCHTPYKSYFSTTSRQEFWEWVTEKFEDYGKLNTKMNISALKSENDK